MRSMVVGALLNSRHALSTALRAVPLPRYAFASRGRMIGARRADAVHNYFSE